MSAFYDLASLVVVPSGYKSGKVYAQKPLTTDGQLTFTRASTATRVNASGLIETVSSGVPRLDYLGSTCPKLLLEPQRTNLTTYSEQFDNAAWTKSDTTITANNAVSPDGYTNADLLTYTTSSGALLKAPYAGSATTATTVSMFVKAGSSSLFNLGMSDGILEGFYYTFNLSNQTATISGALTYWSSPSYKIESYGNGWYRLMVSAVSTSNGQVLFYAPSVTGLTANYYIYGAQLEVASYATSYIPTLGSSVTRVADACSKTGISSLIGQTEGTIFVDLNFDNSTSSFQVGFAISDNANPINKHVWLGRNNHNFLSAFLRNTSYSIQYSPSSGGVTSTGRHKIALAYASNNAALYIDGVQIATTNSVVVPTMNQAELGLFAASIDQADSKINQALLFKTRLTNAQLAELTAL